MPQASRTISINVPPEQAFAFFTDPANDRRWRAAVKEMAASGPLAVGSRVHQVVAGPGGRSIAADIEVTAYDPPSRYAFHGVAGPVRPEGAYTFVASGSGGTDVTFHLSAQLNFLMGLFMGGQVQGSMDGEMASLDRAKAILEGG